MDSQASNVMGVIGFGLTLVGGIYSAINHKRIRSNCCGKLAEASLDIENTTPVKAVSTEPPK
jgi:hypothetical protein